MRRTGSITTRPSASTNCSSSSSPDRRRLTSQEVATQGSPWRFRHSSPGRRQGPTRRCVARSQSISHRQAVDDLRRRDLRRRISATRWPERETVADDSQGVRLALMQELARYWATRLRLAACEAKLNALAELHHRDRRARHPLHPRPLPARGRAAADRHARLARLDHRAAEDHRAADQPDGARRRARRTRSIW